MKFIRHLLQPTSPQPDQPQPFGYKKTWFTISSSDTAAVADAFHLTNVQPCTWNDGLARASSNQLFDSPPIQNWIFVVGQLDLLIDEHALSQRLPLLLNPLSIRFGIAHFFSTHRVVEYHVWARSHSGLLVRAYAYLGERGETLWDAGPATTEADLGLTFFNEQSPDADDPAYWDRTDLHFPDEESVMHIARHWCLAPIDLTPNDSPPALGVRGTFIS